MGKPRLIIKAPKLNDETVVNLQTFFYDLIHAFESHYHHQLKRYYQQSHHLPVSDELDDDGEVPF
jgi:hypothetical protein